jgi:dihydropyrimidine dehydrogenase (NAD+) subunit PreA
MNTTLATRFTGIPFENPFLLASAPPTESDANIMRAFEAGWGGVVVKTIGMHPVVNVKGPKTKFLRSSTDSYRMSMEKRANTALHSSWNWELISDKPLDWWLPRLRRIKEAFPQKVLVASIMAGSEDEKEVNHWRELAQACEAEGVDALELNLSCPHMDRVDMGSNIGKNVQLIDTVVRAVKEVARRPVWVKLTPTTTNIAKEAEAAFTAGADAISSSNTFTSLPPIDAESLEFEVNVEGKVSYGGLGGPAILPLSMAKMAQMATAFPEKSFSGIGGISDFGQALNYFLLGCGTVQVCTAAMLDHAVGPNVIKRLLQGMGEFLEKNGGRGWKRLEDFRGLRRDRIVAHHEIKRPERVESVIAHP